MSRIIICIHGLGNKPPKNTLERWWKRSIREGFRRIDKPLLPVPLEMVYWADLLHPSPLNPSIKDENDPLYIHERYMPCKNPLKREKNNLKSRILKYFEKQLDKIFLNPDMTINFAGVTDIIIRRYFRELEIYYQQQDIHGENSAPMAREIIRQRLAETLKKYNDKEIMLLSHSMGSIVAYDVLTQLAPDINIHTFITIGSPLGLPVVVSRIFAEQKKTKKNLSNLKAPENITHAWFNLSDAEDRVALDHTLSDDYLPNSHGVRAIDVTVYNDYEIRNQPNPHKSYGYLRTPELAEIIYDFIAQEKKSWFTEKWFKTRRWGKNFYRKLKNNLQQRD